MASIEDPYFSGTVADKSEFPDKLGLDRRPPILRWLAVYLFNLVIPLFLGTLVTDPSGRVGMVLGILLVFGLGCRLCFASRRAVLVVVYGGWIVAASQFFPLMHIFAGSIGARVASALGASPGPRADHVNSVAGGLIATVVTGAILLAVAAIFGLIIKGLASAYTSLRGAARSKP